MLIEFKVRNFRSIKDEQTLSLVASKDKTFESTHLIPTGIRGLPNLVKTAAIFGANASGKTNLFAALSYMRAIVAESATIIQLGQTFNVQPFRLDKQSAKESTEFEVIFIKDEVRYQYGFAMNAERINEEWLYVHRKSKPQQWFSRKYNGKTKQDEYDFSSHLTGQRKLWQDSTRSNALFLSTAVQLNSEQLSPIFNWFMQDLIVFPSGSFPLPVYSTQMLKKEKQKQDIQDFMISADISITGIQLISIKAPTREIHLDLEKVIATKVNKEDADLIAPQFTHKTSDGFANFDFQDESHGTQKLFCLAGPVLEILKHGRVLVIDELDAGLHPLLVKHLIQIFYDPRLNPNGAQLLFSIHNTALLNKHLFRRDQIWFVEKNDKQATTLYPLTDFSPRKSEAYENGYLIGRYGAIPFLDDRDL